MMKQVKRYGWCLRNPRFLSTELVARTIERGLSRRTTLRGRANRDGKITLLTVDFRLTDHVIRLGRSFRRYVEPGGRVIVVQNGARSQNRRLKDAGFDVHGFGLNFGHGRALDWGMRFVDSEYTLICDPDSIVLSQQFRAEIMSRLNDYGVAGIVVTDEPKHQYYHPICTAFETRLWKEGNWSWIDDLSREEVPNDVGWEFARYLGGVRSEATIRESCRGLAGQVFGDCFSCTWGAARIHGDGTEEMDGRPRELTLAYHRRWSDWADSVLAGRSGLEDFPLTA